jgi:drug/metabolite transporter (DMT)-like permease
VGLSGVVLAVGVLPLALPPAVSAQDLGLLALLGVVVLPLAFGLIAVGPRYLPAPEVSLIMLLEAVLGPLWVWLVLHEVPSVTTFVGGAVLIGTLSVHALIGLQRAQAVAPATLPD